MQGYQASDSVVQRRGARTLVVQTFDFGTGGRVFGWFEGGLGQGGDDGQVLLLVAGWSTAAMTEDGGAGVQWFTRAPPSPATAISTTTTDHEIDGLSRAPAGKIGKDLAVIPWHYGEARDRKSCCSSRMIERRPVPAG